MDNLDRTRTEYYEAREAYEQAKQAAETAHLAMQNAERSLVDEMLAKNIPSLKVDDGTQVDLRSQLHISTSRKREIREWLNENDADSTPYVSETLDKDAILKLLQGRVKPGELMEIPEFFKPKTLLGVSVRGWKNRGS